MENQKIINLLDNQTIQPSKFRTKKWVEISDDSRGTYNTNSQIKFKNAVLNSSQCNYSDAYIFFKGRITFIGAEAAIAAREADERSKVVTIH